MNPQLNKTKTLCSAFLSIIGAVLFILVPSAGPLRAQTLTLDSCISLARKNNADIRTSQAEVQKAQLLKKQVFTKYFPQVRMAALGYYAANPMVTFGLEDVQSNDIRELLEAIYEAFSEESDITNRLDIMKKGMSGSVSVTQPIYAGGRIRNGNKLAAMGIEAAELQSEMKIRDVLENIESSFYLVLGLGEKVATIDAAMKLIDSLNRVVVAAVENGLVTRSDALQIELKRNEIKALHHQLTSGIRLSRRLLCSQIGIDYSDSLAFVDEKSLQPPTMEFLYRTKGDSLRPEMRLLQLQVDAENLMKKMTIGEALPQLAISGVGYYGNLVRNYTSGNVVGVLTLSIPISDWWETSRKLEQHDIRISQARIMQENLGNLMSLEEEKAYSDMVDSWMLMKSDSSALDIARENYRLANINYSQGVMTLSEVLQAYALLLQAENALTDRRITYIAARRRLTDIRLSGQ